MRVYFLCLAIITSLSGVTKVKTESIVIPKEIQTSCEKWGEEYEICPEVLEAICWQETRCRPDLENGGCIGITQINPKYHKATMELLEVTDLTDYDQNIHVCAYTISEYAKQEDDLYCVLMMWNCGSSRGKKLFYQGVFTEYARKVSEESAELEELHTAPQTLQTVEKHYP